MATDSGPKLGPTRPSFMWPLKLSQSSRLWGNAMLKQLNGSSPARSRWGPCGAGRPVRRIQRRYLQQPAPA